MESISCKSVAYRLPRQDRNEPTLTKNSRIEIGKAVQLYQALSADCSEKSSQFINLVGGA
jgi:hypothetical protein